jgi:predicted ester cyclase
MVAAGDAVIVRCRVSGTHRGVATKRLNGGFLMGIQPTGKRFEVQHIHWYKLRDGTITDHFTNRDDLGMIQQLGLLPVPTAPTAHTGSGSGSAWAAQQ